MEPTLAHHTDVIAGVSDVYAKTIADLRALFPTIVNILFVVDGSISLTEAPSGFGVGRVIRLLRESRIGCTRFVVHTARRNASTAGSPNYTNFRFDQQVAGQPVLNQYQEVWCFGFNPGNDAGVDANITQASALPLSDGELAALTTWMNTRNGGVLAMGDHDYLGASMCHRIPRVRSMRRWTNAQGVPPIGGAADADTHLRHDTNQPATPAQISGGALIPFLNQEDAVPQRIDWVPWLSQRQSVLTIRTRPHPILCHPSHGPIDVMPDHPHEGWCYEDHEIDLTANLGIPTLSGKEYPTVGGVQPRPMVIAHGTTTPNPPFNLDKGPSPRKRFAMISAYDGRAAGVGRVVVDSTWHHWFDENIQAIEAAGGANWDKISRYFWNVAKWLAPASVTNACIVVDVIATHFTYLGFQEYVRKATVFDLGRPLHAYLTRYWGPCWVTEWVFENVRLVDDDLWSWIKDRLFHQHGVPFPPGGDPCLSCPAFDWIEVAVLGGMVRSSFEIADAIKAQSDKARGGKLKLKTKPDKLLEQGLAGVEIGVKEFRAALDKSLKQVRSIA